MLEYISNNQTNYNGAFSVILLECRAVVDLALSRVEASVRFKLVAGTVDEAGGIAVSVDAG